MPEAAAATKVAVAAGRGRRRSLHIGRGARTVPGSPPRRLQPRCSRRCRGGKVRPAPDRGGPGRKFAGRRLRSSGGRGRGAGPVGPRRRPSLLSRSLPRSPGASAAPHCPAIFSAPHTRTPPPPSTTAAAAHGARPAAAEASAHTARPAAAQRTQQAPPQAPPPAPRRPHPDSTRHSSSVGPGLLRP